MAKLRHHAARRFYKGTHLFSVTVTRDHLARDEIMSDSEVLEGALCLRVLNDNCSDVKLSETVGFCSNIGHCHFSRVVI